MTPSPVSAQRRGRAGRSAQVRQSSGPARFAGRIFRFGKQRLYQREGELGPRAMGANTELTPARGLLCGLGLVRRVMLINSVCITALPLHTGCWVRQFTSQMLSF